MEPFHPSTQVVPAPSSSGPSLIHCTSFFTWGGPRGVIVKVMDCGIVVSEFEL